MTSISGVSERDEQAVASLRKFIAESEDELVQKETKDYDDETLLLFIRCRKYNIKSSFERIRGVVSARRNKFPELFDKLYPSRLQHAFDDRVADILESRDSKGRQVLLFRYRYWNPDITCPDDLMRSIFLIVLQMLQAKETQLNGAVIIWDCGDLTFKQARQITPSEIRKYAKILVNANPLKIKECHIMNAPRIFNMTLSLIKMFLTDKLANRIYAHGSSMDSLHKWVSPDILPDWLSGKLTEEEALDHNIKLKLCSKETDLYYRRLFNNEIEISA